METQEKEKNYYVTHNDNIFNPYLSIFQTKDGEFLRRVDSEEADYLREVLCVYEGDDVIEPEEIPNFWNFLFEFELDADDYKDITFLLFTKKNINRKYRLLAVPTANIGFGYIRFGFHMIGYETYNNYLLLEEFLTMHGMHISYKELVSIFKENNKFYELSCLKINREL